MANIYLRIANFNIELVNQSNVPLALEEGYSDFEIPAIKEQADVSVLVHNGIPELKKVLNDPIYSAQFNGSELWRIEQDGNGLRFHVYDPEPPYALQQVAELNEDRSIWNVYMEPSILEEKKVLYPLLYPFGPLVMYYMTVKRDAIMIHGSGIADNNIGRIFTGVSGKGKTTMAKLWYNAGAEVLNDDRLIISKEKGDYVVHNTPMFYQDKPRHASLESIYLIHHAPSNELNRVTGSEAVSRLSANLIQHGYNADLVSRYLNFLTEMVETIPVYTLGFVPNETVVDTIREQQIEHS